MREADRHPVEGTGSALAGSAGSVPGLAPGRIIAYSWLMAAAAIGVLNQLHADLHEHNELPPLLHWLRDGALAVPLAAVAVVAAALVVRSRMAPSGGDPRRSTGGPPGVAFGGPFAWVVLAAGLFAILSIPGNQLHGLLFGAEEEAGGFLADALKDGGITLAASLAVLVPAVALAGPPWRRTRTADEPVRSPGASLAPATGRHASLATTGSTQAGGDR